MQIRIVFPLAAFAAFLPAAGALAAPGGDFERAAQELRDADRNGDGVVSRAEFQQYRVGRWTKMDRNGDGYFSKDDLPALARSRWDSDRLTQLRRDFDRIATVASRAPSSSAGRCRCSMPPIATATIRSARSNCRRWGRRRKRGSRTCRRNGKGWRIAAPALFVWPFRPVQEGFVTVALRRSCSISPV